MTVVNERDDIFVTIVSSVTKLLVTGWLDSPPRLTSIFPLHESLFLDPYPEYFACIIN
jgi:hypothetical protein